jgi:deoxyribodipyrimidine photo-lyase
MKYTVFWFRRDLRIDDNIGLIQALQSGNPVLPLFIFDSDILGSLPKDDARVSFIYEQLAFINDQLHDLGSSLLIKYGTPIEVWKSIIEEFEITQVMTNKDYEPYARRRDGAVRDLLTQKGINFYRFKDQVIFEESDILKNDGKPYTVFTPYKNKWLESFQSTEILPAKYPDATKYIQSDFPFPELEFFGFEKSTTQVKPFRLDELDHYADQRDYPAKDATSYLSPHLRFGTVSIRQIIYSLKESHTVFFNELIWREFFMQILYHFPRVITHNFHSKYDGIKWKNDPADFKRWCEGNTGYPLVDAGMRELNQTGYMHNRVRMVSASFLCKHLLIDWRWGEAYFAEKLLDYDLSANNGNWQWAAGTGCDAAPYFRIFNPSEQLKKFDKNLEYVKKWVPEYNSNSYTNPIVDHKLARERALDTYKKGIETPA